MAPCLCWSESAQQRGYKAWVRVRMVLGLIAFPILGNLLRLGSERLVKAMDERGAHMAASMYPSVLANMGGCFLMGLMYEGRAFFETKLPGSLTFPDVADAPSVYVAITSWLCGSITTYSTLNSVVARRTIDDSFLYALMTGLTAGATAYMALLMGMDLASGFTRISALPPPPEAPSPAASDRGRPLLPEEMDMRDMFERGGSVLADVQAKREREQEAAAAERAAATVVVMEGGEGGGGEKEQEVYAYTKPHERRLIIATEILLYASTTVALLVITVIAIQRRETLRDDPFWLSCLTAPFGAALRYAIALGMARNERIAPFLGRFPLQTFAANVLGSIISALVTVGASDRRAVGDLLGGYYLDALGKGFCGCLSTYSTFALELHKLPTKEAWRYALGTFVASQAIALTIFGSHKAGAW